MRAATAPERDGSQLRHRSGAKRVISNASGRWVSSSTGDPHRVSPTSADRRAVSVASVSGDGSARSSSENWMMRAGAGSSSMVTMSTAGRRADATRDRAAAACAAPAGRASAPAAAARACASTDPTSRRSRRIAAAPRSARSSAADSGSSSRANTNDSGSSASSGHSSSRRLDVARHVRVGHERRRDRARARAAAAPRRACPSRADSSAAGSAASSPSVAIPQRSKDLVAAPRAIAMIDPAAARRPSSGAAAEMADRQIDAATSPVIAVRLGRACASSRAAVCVGAIATRAVSHAPRAARTQLRAIAGGSPINRPSPRHVEQHLAVAGHDARRAARSRARARRNDLPASGAEAGSARVTVSGSRVGSSQAGIRGQCRTCERQDRSRDHGAFRDLLISDSRNQSRGTASSDRVSDRTRRESPGVEVVVGRDVIDRALMTRGRGVDAGEAARARDGRRPASGAGDDSSAIVTPPALRAMRSPPTRSATVSLPSMIRAIRIHVVQRKPPQRRRRHVGEIEDDEAEAAGLEDQRKRFQRARAHRRSRGPTAAREHRGRGRGADAGSKRVATCRPARPLRRARPPPPAPGTATVVRPLDGAPMISDRCPRRRPPPSAASSSADRPWRRAARMRGTAHGAADGQRDVQLAGAEERFEVRRRIVISLFLRLRRGSIVPACAGIKRQWHHARNARIIGC